MLDVFLSYFMSATNSTTISLADFKDVTIICLNIITGVGLIRGFFYLKSLKEKRYAATFTFWIHLRIRLKELLSWLENENGLICNLYDSKIVAEWESFLPPEKERIVEFKMKVEETIQYIKSTPDQMPAYKGWTADYNVLIDFLNDVIQYDICNSKKYFKFKKGTMSDMKTYCDSVCNSIRKLCNNIEEKQNDIEIEMF